ncbi:monooxygenase [Seminavis robusta]|uniref:Monooxygenase n=1 Tax=Seminavis robusta TaxID=568900 RepID=A0A9N8DLV3_9STRA|nr:monooxygenase [Seminavis robusta]|eukprot:Sro232_g093760.1 monooxygenase (695) ;mRNA; f:10875-12959
MMSDWKTGVAVSVMVFGVATPILQHVCLHLSSKCPRTSPTTREFLVQDKDKDVFATPYLKYLPARIVANLLMMAVSMIPNLALFTFTVGFPLYFIRNLAGPYFYHSLAILSLFLLEYAWKLYKAPRTEPSDELPAKEKKKVCIIGGGCAGLVTAKELAAEGHCPIIFEKTASIGGLWQRGEGASQRTALVLEETYTSSSALNTAFSDFPIQPEFGGNETFCMHQEGFMKYVDAYANHFGLKQYVQVNTEVLTVRRNTCDKWEVAVLQNKQHITHEFDAVAVCSGQANMPNIPKIPGQEHFKGRIRHSTELRDPEQMAQIYNGKRVLCIGHGETASDNAQSVAKSAIQCDLSIRNAVLVLLRNSLGAHPDYVEHRSMHSCPPWLRWATYMLACGFMFMFNWAFARVYDGKVYHLPSCIHQYRLLFTPKYLWHCLTGKRSICASVQVTKSENFLYIINGKTSKVKPEVGHIDKVGKIIFQDGTSGDYDEILLNTGFQPSRFPFLAPGFDSNPRDDRFLAMIHPQLPDMAFIGFARGQVGALVLGFEMQARWFALLVSGKRNLPTVCEMKKVIAKDRLEKDCTQYTRGTWFYANYLARFYVKCEPNFVQFFLEHPIACLKAYCSAPTGYQYRIRGPHADPKAAVEGYRLSNSAILYLPPSWALNHFFWLLSGFACEYLWSRLPLLGPFFLPALAQYH